MSPHDITLEMECKDLLTRTVESYCEHYFNFGFNPAIPVVRLHGPSYGPEEIMGALEVLLSTNVTQGKLVKEFEEKYSYFVDLQNCVACNSGSSANLLAISALCSLGDLRRGDEVIVPALSWSTTIWPLVQHGLIPVFVDCDPETFNIDPREVEKALSSKTRAVMLVHLYGNPCDMNWLREVCRKVNPILIEDCCEAMGAEFEEKPVGTFGDISTFSFYFSHHITTMEGGMVTTPHQDVEQKLRIQRSHGWTREVEDQEALRKKYPNIDPKFLFVDTGYNLRLTELAAAMGLKQLGKLEGILTTRFYNNLHYRGALQPLGLFDFQKEHFGGSSFGFSLILKDDAPFTVSAIRTFLKSRDIETRPIVAGNMATQPAMSKFPHQVQGGLENTNRIMNRGFAIANHHHINAEARNYVVENIKEFTCEHS